MKAPTDTLRGLKVAITGGTSGLGLALVEQLHAAGAQVAFVARDNIVTKEGFALLPGAIVDQHFVRRRRLNRLISAVLAASARRHTTGRARRDRAVAIEQRARPPA